MFILQKSFGDKFSMKSSGLTYLSGIKERKQPSDDRVPCLSRARAEPIKAEVTSVHRE